MEQKRPTVSLEKLRAQKEELAGKKKGKEKEIKKLENQIKKVQQWNQYDACWQAERQAEEAYNAALNNWQSRIIREGCIEVSCGKPIGRTIDVKINIRLKK